MATRPRTAVPSVDEAEVPLPRRGSENRVIGASGKPLLVIVEGSDIDAMVDAGIEAIGGLRRIIGDHQEVLLKPNTNQRDPFPSITSPEHIRAVARHCRAAGVQRVIIHEDHKPEAGRPDTDLYYRPAELADADIQLSRAGVSEDYVLVEHVPWHPEVGVSEIPADAASPWLKGLLERGYQGTSGPRLRVARQVQEAAVVISLPVLKRHFAGQITSALKNHFGSVYGAHRWLAHAILQIDRVYFDRKLAEFASAVRPELTITDVRSLQAVFGPMVREETRIVRGVNRLIVSGDMVAADVVAMSIMKRYDDTFTGSHEAIVKRQHEHAEELDVGWADLSRFEVIELSV